MTLQDLMSGTFTLSGAGTFQADNMYMQVPVVLNCVNAQFSLTYDSATIDLEGMGAYFQFTLAGANLASITVNVSATVQYDNWTKFVGMFTL